MLLRCGSQTLDLTTPVVMGILNVTPDSFSDGGKFAAADSAIGHAFEMIEAGAGIIDIGGESTRPGAAEVSAEEEIRRVVPIVAELARRMSVPISVDTSKPEVIRAALDAGASMINDVRALREPAALEAVAASDAAVCLMHMQGEPRSMQHDPQYVDVVTEVCEFLRDRMQACHDAGIAADRIVLDPGIGFGKRLPHNLALLARLPALAALGCPILIGVSRKSMFRDLLNRPLEQRLAGGLAVATASVLAGARILRVHDVAETADAIKVAAALAAAGYNSGEQHGS
jgi:dihydropteroate synthase